MEYDIALPLFILVLTTSFWRVVCVGLCYVNKRKFPIPFILPLFLLTTRELKTAAVVPTRHKQARISGIPTPRVTVLIKYPVLLWNWGLQHSLHDNELANHSQL